MRRLNLKRAVAGVLSSMLLMTSVIVPGTTAKADVDSVIIDTAKPVSLTITKYASENGTPGPAGTGEEVTSGIDSNYKPLQGVTFAAYKVADIIQGTVEGKVSVQYELVSELNELSNLNNAGISNVTVDGELKKCVDAGMSTSTIKSTFMKEVSTGVYSTDIANDTVTGAWNVSKTTGADGKIIINKDAGLTQGLYLVVETNKPAKVTQSVDPFLVSLPTSINKIVAENTVSEWIYDVYAYPKNSTKVGALTIEKKDDKNESVKEARFILEESKDSGSTWTKVTKDANTTSYPNEAVFTTAADGKVEIANIPQGLYRIVEIDSPVSYITQSNVVYEFMMTNAGTVQVETSQDTWTSADNNTITITNYKPTIEKKVLKKGGNESNAGDWTKVADYSFGDSVKHKVIVSVPSFIDELKTFTIEDRWGTGIYDLGDSPTFNITYIKTGESNPSVTGPVKNGNTGWKWVLSDAEKTAIKEAGVTSIEIVYEATLTNSATVAGNGNSNKATLEFTNQIFNNSIYENPNAATYDESTTTIEDKNVVFTWQILLDKLFEGSDNTSLKAKFELYGSTKDGENVVIDRTNLIKGDIEVNNKGSIDIDGLSNGIYYLVAVTTADDYTLLKEPIKIVIENNVEWQGYSPIVLEKQYKNIDGEKTDVTPPSDEETTTNETFTITSSDEATKSSNGVTTVKVVSRKGFAFPSTGGRGTLIFTVTGISLMAIAVAIFMASKKKKTVK